MSDGHFSIKNFVKTNMLNAYLTDLKLELMHILQKRCFFGIMDLQHIFVDQRVCASEGHGKNLFILKITAHNYFISESNFRLIK